MADNNAADLAQRGKATWRGNRLTITDIGPMNYWYVPQEPDQVGFCAAPTRSRGDAWIISDQFGGCEWHIRQND